MAISPYKTFSAGEILTASDLNSSFSHITTNAEDLAWPATKAKNFNAQSLVLDGDGDTSITADTDDQIDFQLGGVDAFTMYTVASAVNGLSFTSSATGDPVLISAYGTDTNIDISLVPKGTGVVTLGASVASGIVDLDGQELILDADGDTSISASTDDRIDFKLAGATKAKMISSGSLELGDEALAATVFVDFHSSGNAVDYDARIEASGGSATLKNGAIAFRASSVVFDAIADLNGKELVLDVDADTSITADTDDTIDIKIGGTDTYFLTATGLDINGKELILDVDGDTAILADTDDRIDFKIGGTDIFRFSSAGGLEIGPDAAGTRVIDFHSSANVVDYDTRIQSTGGTAISGNGTLTFIAATSAFSSAVNFSSAVDFSSTVDLNGNELILDADGDTSITADTDDRIDFKLGGSDKIRIQTNMEFLNGMGIDLNGHSLILDVDGDTSITADSVDRIDFNTGGIDRMRLGTNLLFVNSSGIDLDGNQVILDVDGDTSISASTDDRIDFKLAGATKAQMISTGSLELGDPALSATVFVDFHSSGNAVDYDARIEASGGSATLKNGALAFRASSVVFDATADLNGNELVLDANADTSITADTDDQIDFKVGGADRIRMFSNELGPVTDSVTDLGDTTRRWANCYIDDLTITNGIDQGNLKSTTGTVNTVGTALENFTLPGGEYGFYPQLKETGDGIQAQLSGLGTVIEIGSVFVTNITLDVNSGVGSAQQRYIQASPPYDLGDGDVPLFVFARVDNATKEVLSAYVAPEAPWHYNGPTSIVPDFKKDGKKYQRKRMLTPEVEALRKRADFLTDPVVRDEYLAARKAAPVVDVEITQAIYQADMDIIPHPFRTVVPGTTIVLLDPVADILSEWLTLHEAGEDIFEILRSHARVGNTALTRFGPAGVMIPSIKWKITR